MSTYRTKVTGRLNIGVNGMVTLPLTPIHRHSSAALLLSARKV